MPRTYPCLSSPYDAGYLEAGYDDPYHENPKIPAIFEDYTGWKCGFNAAITERTGNVIFRNFKIADNQIAGIEYAEIEDVEYGYAYIEGATIVGNSGYNDEDGAISGNTTWGFIGPKTENFMIKDSSFFNFDHGWNSAPLGTCSHCFHPDATDSGARTYTTSNLYFENCPLKINYQMPYREIIHDLDGSMTGLGVESYAVFEQPHLLVPECFSAQDTHGGVICDGSVHVRRIAFHKMEDKFRLIPIKVAIWDEDVEQAMEADEDTLFDFKNNVNGVWSNYQMRDKVEPSNGWAFPIVTGHKFRFHWGEGIDFENMSFDISPLWDENDDSVHLMTNFTDVRMAINITDRGGNLIANETYL